MAKVKRTKSTTVQLSDDEIAKLHALADSQDASVADIVRGLVVASYARRFGDAPPPEPKLKFKPRTATERNEP
jgi:hypothetical protein